MASSNCVVDLDGPALTVRRKHRSDARYPLGRVSRIVSAESVEWKARALSTCLSRGIPIVLLNATGSPVGYVQPASGVRSSLDRLLCELLERPDWREHHGNWLRAERMRAVQTWVWHRDSAGHPVDDEERKEAVRRFVYASDPPQALGSQAGICQAALMALACEKIRKAGLASTYAGVGGAELHVAVDLCDLLALALELELHGLGSVATTQTRTTLHIIEAYTEGLERRCEHILGRLHRRVLELLREWR